MVWSVNKMFSKKEHRIKGKETALGVLHDALHMAGT